MKTLLTVFFFLALYIPSQAQDLPPGAKQQAKAQLQQMTPEQIEAKIKELGMTMQEAEAKAAEAGIDLKTYVQQRIAPTGVVTPEQAEQMKAESKPDLPTADKPRTEAMEEAGVKPEEAEKAPETERERKAEDEFIGPGGMKYFGYDLFAVVPSAFEPLAVGPVDPEYLIGPEDVLRIIVWGQAEFQNELAVDREGRIFITTVGPVLLSGLTLDEAYKKLLKQMSRSYSGLVSQPPTVWLDLSLARVRPKKIFLMGEVKKPGGYTVSTYATVFNSLYGVGGPTVHGSLRDVRVIRGNKVIARIDLYDYLTGANETNDLRVQSNDVVFIPVRGRTISIKGEVKRPAIYELKEDENLERLIDIAGNLKSTAYVERIQVERILPFDQRRRGHPEVVIVDVDYRDIKIKKEDFRLADGDAVTVYSVHDLKLNFVSLKGAVVRPGSYQLEKVPTLRDLVLAADSLLPEAYLERADILRTRPDFTLEAIRVNLRAAMQGHSLDNILLQGLDQIRIYSIHETEDRTFVSVRGHVKNPGRYVHADSLNLYDLVFKAGGLTDSLFRARTFLDRADLIRLNRDGITKRTIPFDLGDLLAGDPGVNRLLKAEDEVVIYEIDVVEFRDKYIEVFGEVRRTGQFPLTTNMTLTDAILLAGGFTEQGWRLQAEVARTVETGSEDTLSTLFFPRLPDLSDSLQRSRVKLELRRTSDFQLDHRDQIFVRLNPEFTPQEHVQITGEVRFPGLYALRERNETLSQLFRRAGGPKKSGFLKGGRMLRDTIRVNVDFEAVILERSAKEDVVLQAGDKIHIPPKPSSVLVSGEVYNPGLLGFTEGDNLWDYVERAGGVTDSAQYVLVSYPSGNVEKYGISWTSRLFSSNPDLPDGTAIRVTRIPPKPPEEKFDYAGVIKDVFAISASTLTILVLANQLR